jgi:hypothetical protein
MYTYNGILLRLKNEGNSDTHNTDELEDSIPSEISQLQKDESRVILLIVKGSKMCDRQTVLVFWGAVV